jgi:hypothetical protein
MVTAATVASSAPFERLEGDRDCGVVGAADARAGRRRPGGFRREQACHPLCERQWRLTTGKSRPLYFAKPVRHPRRRVCRVVDDDGQEKRLVCSDQVRPVHGELPLQAEVALSSRLGVMRNHRDEQGAGLDLLPDRGVPSVPAAQPALVEPDFDAG